MTDRWRSRWRAAGLSRWHAGDGRSKGGRTSSFLVAVTVFVALISHHIKLQIPISSSMKLTLHFPGSYRSIMVVGSLSRLDPTKRETPQGQKPHRRSSPVCHSMAEFPQEARTTIQKETTDRPFRVHQGGYRQADAKRLSYRCSNLRALVRSKLLCSVQLQTKST